MAHSMHVVEARENGELVTDRARRPPFAVASEAQLFDYYTSREPNGAVTWEAMECWFNKQGWYIQPKTW